MADKFACFAARLCSSGAPRRAGKRRVIRPNAASIHPYYEGCGKYLPLCAVPRRAAIVICVLSASEAAAQKHLQRSRARSVQAHALYIQARFKARGLWGRLCALTGRAALKRRLSGARRRPSRRPARLSRRRASGCSSRGTPARAPAARPR